MPPPGAQRLLLVALALHLAAPGSCLSRHQLLPFGTTHGDARLPSGDDVASEPLKLAQPLHFYQGSIPTLHVGTNGYISTSKPSKEEDYLGIFPPSFGSVSPFLADLDTTDGRGKIFYREDASYEILQLVQEHIKRGFPNVTFIPDYAVIVTWEDVAPYYEQRGDTIPENKRNTFQAVLASDRSSSYAVFLYPENGFQFYGTQSRKAYSEEQMVPAKVGFNKGQTPFLFWKQQGPKNEIANDEQSVKNMFRSSNSDWQGLWVFEIGSSPNSIVAAKISNDPEETNVSEDEYQVVVPPTKIQSSDFVDEDHTQKRYDNHNNGEDAHRVPEQPEDHSQNEVAQRTAETDATPEHPYVDQQPDHSHLETQPSQFLVKQITQQNPQVVVIDDVFDDTGVVFQYNTDNRETCSNSRHQCSNLAACKDYATGFCCSCLPGYYGNGRQCVAEGSPQRVNGKVKGRIYIGSNSAPIIFENIDLHSYVVVNDGRSYTAISTIQESLGYSLLPLASVGGIIGWMFALEQPGFKNGFSLTGGEFARQAEVSFLQGNEKLVIKQQFSGIDEHGHLTISTELDGRVPEIPLGSSVIIEPYTELYHSSSSVVTSSSTREYTVAFPRGESRTYTYQWRQTITFQECIHDNTDIPNPGTQQLFVDRVFVLYNTEEQILRYALSNSIGPVSDGPADTNRNPCYIGSHGCDTNAVCRPGQGNQFTCECSAGFHGEGRTCFDIDECREQPAVCGSNTICNNQPGTFRCECIDGYQFSDDGRTCVAVERPINHCLSGTHNCDSPERARCMYTGASSYICACLSGFSGEGHSCVDVDECHSNRCHPDAMCYNTLGSYTCQCKAGYHGDGFQCASGETEKTKCQHHRESVFGTGDTFFPRGPRPVGQFIPQCDEQGNYKPVQCHSSSGYCWCVDREGNELDGTRTGPGIRPPCLNTVPPVPPVGPTVRPDIIPLPPGTHLLFAQSGKIEHVPLEGTSMKKTDVKALLHVPDKVIIGVAYDCVDKMVYWTDISGPSISRASIVGGEPTAVIKTGLGSPEGITVDHLGRNIFWTDSQQDRIEVAKLDGSQRRMLFDTDLVNPRGIAADPARGNLYWTDWNRDAPKIETSYLDGTNRRILVKDDLGLPNGLTVDPYSSVLCWVDAGTKRVECMNPNQPGRRKILEGVQYPFGITSYGKNLYYTDWRRDAVVAVDRTISEENDDFQPHKRSRLYGITTAYAQCPPGHNYCTVNNGGCTHLCLATPGGRSCRCPENTVGVDCIERN